jgi:N-acetylmuramoyl-L-alanine amidase
MPRIFAPLLLALLSSTVLAEPCDRGTFVIALDPGHTLASPGAISARGIPEVRFNHELAGVVYDELRHAGFEKVFMIDNIREAPSLTQRAGLANERRADVFLSLHHDSVQPRYLSSWLYDGIRHTYSDRYSGYSLFVSDKNASLQDSLLFARLLGTELRKRCMVATRHHAEVIPGEGRELIDPERGIYRFDDLVVLKATRMPAVLFEAGLIVNRADELTLQSPGRRRMLAQAITAAVGRFCAHEAAPPDAAVDCDTVASEPATTR